jgi:cytochrome b
MPFVAYVHARDPEPDPPERPAWEPNWRLWRWLIAAAFVAYGAARTEGAMELALVFVLFGLVLRAAAELVPDVGGMRDYRQ